MFFVFNLILNEVVKDNSNRQISKQQNGQDSDAEFSIVNVSEEDHEHEYSKSSIHEDSFRGDNRAGITLVDKIAPFFSPYSLQNVVKC